MNIVHPEAISSLLTFPQRSVNQMWQMSLYAWTTEDYKIQKNNL